MRPSPDKTWRIAYGDHPRQVVATAQLVGDDLSVVVQGGSSPHIGAVVIAIPRPSIADPNVISSTSSVFNRVGHKDDVVAREAAERLAAKLNRVAVVQAGIHNDNATPEDIRSFLKLASQCIDALLQQIPGRTS